MGSWSNRPSDRAAQILRRFRCPRSPRCRRQTAADKSSSRKCAEKNHRAVSAAFPQIREVGGYRPDSLHWHPDGLALDIMVPGWNTPGGKAFGDQVLRFLMTNKSTLGIDHAIWRQAIHYDGDGGQMMDNHGSPTQNHMDHIHVATKGGGYPRGGEVFRL